MILNKTMRSRRHVYPIAIWFVLGLAARSQQAPAIEEAPTAEPVKAAPIAGDQLSIEQARLADRFKRLEEVLGRLAEFSASTDPRRAKLLREAIAQSREQDMNVRFESIVKLLEDERLSAAATNQTELQQELAALLDLLLKADRDKELASERDRVKKYLKEVARLIRMQKGVRARTEGGDELGQLSKDQERVASDTGKLSGDISDTEGAGKQQGESATREDESSGGDESSGNKGPKSTNEESPKSVDKPNSGAESNGGESPKPNGAHDGQPPGSSPSEPNSGSPSESGEPSPGQPGAGSPGPSGPPSPGGSNSGDQQPQSPQEPADRAAQRLRAAQEQMEQARKDLDDAKRQGAVDRQREALRALEQAKADLERILRQLREEELERTLTQLAARFRKMLEVQNQVYEGTVRLHEIPPAKRDHDDEIEAARLSRQESQIVLEADKARLLLREEGSSVAFPEIVEQMRDDMKQIVERLAAFKVGTITQTLEQDVIAALEETIAALEKAIKDLEKNGAMPGRPSASGEPPEPPLVDKLAELKMIRALQMRINKRTQRFGGMIEGEQAETAELFEALRELSERQLRVLQATADLEQGRND
jgi:hypothetical protein